MKREKGTLTNGASIFRDLSRDDVDSSKAGLVALGQRVVKPPRASQDDFEDRLRAWEEDVERLNRITTSEVSAELRSDDIGSSYI